MLLNTYKRFDVELVKGDGAHCWDAKEREFIDLTSGIGVNSLGFADAGWVRAVQKQAAKLQHTSNLFHTKPAAKLARKLCERTGYAGVFLCNSGAEANEGAIKVARKWAFERWAAAQSGAGTGGGAGGAGGANGAGQNAAQNGWQNPAQNPVANSSNSNLAGNFAQNGVTNQPNSNLPHFAAPNPAQTPAPAQTYNGERSTILVLKNSFHGRTITTLSATAQASFHQYFFPFTPGFKEATLADAAAALSPDVCAVMVEFIQGEGGVVALDAAAVRELHAECQRRGILFIADEVQTGVGRTGRLLASEHYGILPDITTLAKGLGGGLPIGAVLVGERLFGVLGQGDHGSTFGGNPVVCAGACEVLRRLNEKTLRGVRERGELVREMLAGCGEVAQISGLGLMIGIKLATKNARDVAEACIERGVLCLTAKDRVRLLPPLNIAMKDLKRAVKILRSVLESC